MKSIKLIFISLLIGSLLLWTSPIYSEVGGPYGQTSGVKTLTNNVATGIFKISLPSNSSCGGIILYVIYASNGTNFSAHAGYASFTAVNKGGVYTTNIAHISSASGGESTSNSSGTLTDVWTITTGVDLITINLRANYSLLTNPVIQYNLFLLSSNKTLTLL
jgi:hypothetical protein